MRLAVGHSPPVAVDALRPARCLRKGVYSVGEFERSSCALAGVTLSRWSLFVGDSSAATAAPCCCRGLSANLRT